MAGDSRFDLGLADFTSPPKSLSPLRGVEARSLRKTGSQWLRRLSPSTTFRRSPGPPARAARCCRSIARGTSKSAGGGHRTRLRHPWRSSGGRRFIDDDRVECREALHDGIESRNVPIELRLRRADGMDRWFRVFVSPMDERGPAERVGSASAPTSTITSAKGKSLHFSRKPAKSWRNRSICRPRSTVCSPSSFRIWRLGRNRSLRRRRSLEDRRSGSCRHRKGAAGETPRRTLHARSALRAADCGGIAQRPADAHKRSQRRTAQEGGGPRIYSR